jgi:uncharacterized YceG family protein
MPRFRRQEPSRERTPDEREAARIERESRRTGARGASPRTPAAIARADAAPPADPDWPDEEEVATRAELRRALAPPGEEQAGAVSAGALEATAEPEPEPVDVVAEPPAEAPEAAPPVAEPVEAVAQSPPTEVHDVVAEPAPVSERVEVVVEPPPTEVHEVVAEPAPPPEPPDVVAEPGPPTEAFDVVAHPPPADPPTEAFDVVAEPPPPAEPPTEAYDVAEELRAARIAPDEGPQPTVAFDALAGDPPAEPAPLTPAARRAQARYGDEEERPVPLRRPGARRTLPPTPPAPGSPGGSGPRRPRRSGGGGGGGGGGGSRRPFLLLAGLLALVVLAGAAYVAVSTFQPFAGEGEGDVRVEVPRNATATEIAELLEREGVVGSSTFFNLRARIDGAREDFKAGTYTLRRGMPYGDAIAALQAGPPPPRTINVTIPEGRSRRETAPLVRQAGLDGSYLRASRSPTDGFSLRRYGAPGDSSLEGFLFPATYELRPNANARTLVARQLDAFAENFGQVDLAPARRRDLDPYDVLIIASMIEREATLARERRTMSAVIHNRLEQGIPLGIDATTRYETDNWTRPIRQSELEADTPYNTRLNTGLPPTPIGNPGLASMRAAANPSDSDALFYVAVICGDGAHDFSSTAAEFERDVARYNAERERRGGNAPTSC